MSMGLCVSFKPLEHVWVLKALNPLLKYLRSEAWKAQGVAVLFSTLWNFFCYLNEDYWTAEKCQRFPSRCIKDRCSVSPHTLWPLVRGTSAGKKALQCGYRSQERVLFTPTLHYKWLCLISKHYFVYLGTRDIGHPIYYYICILDILRNRMADVKNSCWFLVRSLMCGTASY